MTQASTHKSIYNGQPLTEAFDVFNQVSEQLSESYQRLEQQVERLGKELACANSEKIQYLSDKDELAAQLEALVEAIPGAVIVQDEQQRVVKLNACARLWLGDGLLGTDGSSIGATQPARDETPPLRLANGLTVVRSNTDLGVGRGYITLLSDITQQQELQCQLEHKNKLADMGQLSASLAHQLRTPLASALLYASQLNADTLDERHRSLFSNKLLKCLHQLNSRISDMLSYSHAGQWPKARLELNKFCQQLKESYQDKAVKFNTLEDSFESALAIHVSADALLGAVGNLIDNALEASDGEVVCCIEWVGGTSLVIKVVDQGMGITQQQQQRIFEPFYTNKINGTGLGLAVVSDVVNAHAGDIRCDSEFSIGTTMELTLPVVIADGIGDSNRRIKR